MAVRWLSEKSQTQNTTSCLILFIWSVKNRQIFETLSRLGDSRIHKRCSSDFSLSLLQCVTLLMHMEGVQTLAGTKTAGKGRQLWVFVFDTAPKLNSCLEISSNVASGSTAMNLSLLYICERTRPGVWVDEKNYFGLTDPWKVLRPPEVPGPRSENCSSTARSPHLWWPAEGQRADPDSD
jgi:hypothetical protein